MDVPTTLIASRLFRLHDTGMHVENARRLDVIDARLRERGMLDGRAVIEPTPATFDDIVLVHDPGYVRLIADTATSGGRYLDADTVVSPMTYDIALLAAGSAIDAVDMVLKTDARRVFALPRPPGHHAEPSMGMGFCIFNNIAIGARHAIDRRGLQRVAIIDWDVHHGNGTQAAFYDSEQVLFISLHQWPLYPGTGRRDEVGRGYGQNDTLNLPLPPGSGDDTYLRLFDEVIGPRLMEYQPELLMVSAGFDAHRDDPLALMDLTDAGFHAMAGRVRAWADQLCDGRLVVMLEGGYNLRTLGASVEAALRGFDRLPLDEEAVG